MHGYRAYSQQKKTLPSRIDLILTLYRKAIDLLDRADALLAEQNVEGARPLLTKVQLIVSGLGAGLVETADESAQNFRRLYEFTSFKVAQGERNDLVAARRILAMLLETFEAVRPQATQLELEGKIPALDETGHVSLST